jgi:hypothetical protein
MPRVTMPESWYKGTVSLSDNLWRINLVTEEYDQIFADREEVQQSFDIHKIQISPNENFILFVNKRDLTLWSVEVGNIIR